MMKSQFKLTQGREVTVLTKPTTTLKHRIRPAQTKNGQLPRKQLIAALLTGSSCLIGTSPVFADGGDTQATSACISSLPFNDTGTTVSKVDDYDLPPDTISPTLTAACATATGKGPPGSLPAGAVYTGTGTGPDVVYRMDFPVGNPDALTVTMTPTGGQDLTLVAYCNTVSSSLSDGLAVSDTGSANVAESITLSNIVAGTSLYFVVDGYSSGATPPGPAGPFTFSVTSAGATQPASTCATDLAITATDGVTKVIAGKPVIYTITASNPSLIPVTGATVADTFSSDLTDISWTCIGAGGGTCTASGTGNINDLVNLPASGSVTYTVNGTVSITNSGSLVNTATVSTPAGITDATPANNSATDTDDIDYAGAGGALSWLTLLPMAALAALARRRRKRSS